MPAIATTTWFNACLLVLAGGFAAQHSRVALNSDLCELLFVASVAFIAVRRVRWIAFASLGYASFVIAAMSVVEQRLAAQYAGDSMLTEVVIATIPRVAGDTLTMQVAPLDDPRIPPNTRLSWYEAPQLPQVGETWQLELRLKRPRGRSNVGTFDVEHWLFRNRIHATGYVVSGKRNRLIADASSSWVDGYREVLSARARQYAGDSAAVLTAISVGERGGITRPQWQRYAVTGTSHLMAISGLHIGLAASFAFFVVVMACGLLRPVGNYLVIAAVTALAAAFLYAWISGLAVPALRAVSMLAIATFAFMLKRRVDPLRVLPQAALLVYLIDPLTIMLPGFGLSFAAVLVLLIAAQRYRRKRRFRWLTELATMQLVLLFGLMPLTAAFFQRVSLVAPAVNLIAVPVFSFITVPSALCSMLLFPIWEDAGVLLLRIAASSVAAIEWLIDRFAELRVASRPVAAGAGWFIAIPALWLIVPRGLPGRALAILGVAALLLHRPESPPQNCFDSRVLDVGQGLAVIVQSASKTLLFDTGASFRDGGSMAEQIVIPHLQSRATHRLDTLVVSHADDDHAGGVEALLQNLVVGEVYFGEELQPRPGRATFCRAGTQWHADGIHFEFLHPGADTRLQGNDLSCVLLVAAGSHRLLLTGDIEAEGELQVLQRLNVDAVDVVVIPHHGSLTSSAPPFVNRLSPSYAIASAGYGNRWGFPKARVIARWEGSGATALSTATSGAISFRICADSGVTGLRQERVAMQRFWNDS